VRNGRGYFLYIVSKTLGIPPSEALKLSEFDYNIILEGILYEKTAGKTKKKEKINISEMTDEELKSLKDEMMKEMI